MSLRWCGLPTNRPTQLQFVFSSPLLRIIRWLLTAANGKDSCRTHSGSLVSAFHVGTKDFITVSALPVAAKDETVAGVAASGVTRLDVARRTGRHTARRPT